MAESQAALLLMKQLKDLRKHPLEGFSAGLKDEDNPLIWEIVIIGPPDTPYEGGFFKAEMKFTTDYPNQPPELRFTSEFWHPNAFCTHLEMIATVMRLHLSVGFRFTPLSRF